jgi:hypothetical protein
VCEPEDDRRAGHERGAATRPVAPGSAFAPAAITDRTTIVP